MLIKIILSIFFWATLTYVLVYLWERAAKKRDKKHHIRLQQHRDIAEKHKKNNTVFYFRIDLAFPDLPWERWEVEERAFYAKVLEVGHKKIRLRVLQKNDYDDSLFHSNFTEAVKVINIEDLSSHFVQVPDGKVERG